jgi:hypothetical protein
MQLTLTVKAQADFTTLIALISWIAVKLKL